MTDENVTEQAVPDGRERAIESTKKQFGEVHSVDVRGIEYLIRPLRHAEWKQMKKQQRDELETGKVTIPEAQDRQEVRIACRCTAFPKLDEMGLASMPAGIVTTLSNAIMQISGFEQDSMPIKL